MADPGGTMLDMTKKSKPKQTQGRSPNYTVFARIEPTLGKALEEYLGKVRPKPTVTAVIEAALEEFLAKAGYWPRDDV